MKTIIVYKSNYGTCKQYAQWLADALQCKAETNVKPDELQTYDVIVYIGGLYAGGINGFKWFRKQFDDLADKKLILCMVGMTTPAESGKYEQVFVKNVPEKYREKIQYFALRGDQLYSKMNFIHRNMMKMPKRMAEKIPENERTQEDIQFIESYGKDILFSAKENINCVVEYIGTLGQ